MPVWAFSFAIQLAAAPVIVWFGANWLSEQLWLLVQPYRSLEGPAKFVEIMMPVLVGFLLGIILRKLPGFFHEPGRWIWCVPAFAAAGILGTSTLVSLDRYWVGIFGARGYQYSGIGVVGLLFPLGGVFLYSIGIRSGDRHTDPLEGAEQNYDGPQAY